MNVDKVIEQIHIKSIGVTSLKRDSIIVEKKGSKNISTEYYPNGFCFSGFYEGTPVYVTYDEDLKNFKITMNTYYQNPKGFQSKLEWEAYGRIALMMVRNLDSMKQEAIEERRVK